MNDNPKLLICDDPTPTLAEAIRPRSPMLGAAMLGMVLAGAGMFNGASPRYSVGASAALPDDPERARRAEEKRKRRAAKPGASNYAKRNA